jgi:hypothetical protein
MWGSSHLTVNHHISGHFVFHLVSTEWVMMYPVMTNTPSCKIHAVICFTHTKDMHAVEIIIGVVPNDLRWVGEQVLAMKNEMVGWPSVVTDCSKRWPKLWKVAFYDFRILAWISTNFTHFTVWDISWAILSQVSQKMGSENAHSCLQNS